jgi:hypothetical protein
MATYLVETELGDPRLVRKREARTNTVAEFRRPAETQGSPARGILIALAISAPIWALIGCTIYMLL